MHWWTEQPFNYSAVNNAGAPHGDGEVLVFLNDDTEVLDPTLADRAGRLGRPSRASASSGLQLHRPRRRAPARRRRRRHRRLRRPRLRGHGARLARACSARPTGTATCSPSPAPASPSGARSSTQLGGFDERFVLTGSDVALGLDAVLHGLRNVCSPTPRCRHLESAPAARTSRPRTSSPATGATTPGCSAATRTARRTSRCGSRGPAAARRRTSRRPRERVGGPLGRHVHGVPAAERRGRVAGCSPTPAGRRAADRRRSPRCTPRTAEPFAGADRQLVHPRHRQPVLRRHQHRAAHRRPARPRARRREPVRRLGEPARPLRPLGDRGGVPVARPTRRSPSTTGRSATSLASCRPPTSAIATLWVTAYAVAHAPGTPAEVLPGAGLRADVLPGRHASTRWPRRPTGWGCTAICNTDNLRADLRAATTAAGHVVHARRRPDGLPRPRPARAARPRTR